MRNVPNVREIVQQSVIPVYGVTENFLNLKLILIGKALGQTPSQILLYFSTASFDSEVQFNLISYNNDKVIRDKVLKTLQPAPRPFLSRDSITLRHFGFEVPIDESVHTTKVVLGENNQLTKQFLNREKKQIQVLPIESMERVTIGSQTFTSVMHCWQQSPFPAWFLLYNDDEIFLGQALGFPKNELSQILQHCTVVNFNEEIIHQYQQELNQRAEDWKNEM